MMELSSEDALRLNVMLANELQAVRINESAMTVHGLTPEGETTIRLNPTGREDNYLRKVKETLSSHVLGSPGGYPVFLKRWTRMGQARDDSLERLLMLGEPEAVVAVVHAEGLTGELARRAWWCMPSAETARRMLQREAVAQGALGAEMARYLIEYLPFEDDPQAMMESVQLALQPGLVSEAECQRLWDKARHKNTYYMGFLTALPDALPEPLAPHPALADNADALQALCNAGNPVAEQLLRTLSAAGQTYLATARLVLKKPQNQEVVVALMNALGGYFSAVRPQVVERDDMQAIIDAVEALCGRQADTSSAGGPQGLDAVLKTLPMLAPQVGAMLAMACLEEAVVTPIFARTDAIGTVMRRRLEPVTQPLLTLFARLQGSGR